MSNFEVIGISGKANVGKDHLVKHEFDPLGYKQISFAWHFKVELVARGEATHEDVFLTKPPHVRTRLQEIGNYYREKFGGDYWVKVVEEWMRVLHDHMAIDKFVIADIRFPEEAAWVKRLGGKVFRIQAPQRESESRLTLEQRRDISETALDNYGDFDGIIANDPEDGPTVAQQIHDLLHGNGQTLTQSMSTSFESQLDRFREILKQAKQQRGNSGA
jgi:hypothetical protein